MTSPNGSWPGQQGSWQAPGSSARPTWQQPTAAPVWPQQQSFGNQPSWQPAPPFQAAQPLAFPQAQPQPMYGNRPSWQAPPAPASQFGYPNSGYSPMPQQPRRGGAGKIILAAVGVVVLLGFGISIINALTGGGVSAGNYVNESYTPPAPDLNPPALPTVTTVAQAQEMVLNNTFYNQTVPQPTRCDVSTIDLSTASADALDTYMNSIVGCLMRVWSRPVEQAGYQMPRPPVLIYSKPVTTGCGKSETLNAFYCGADQKIYYATDLPKILPPDLRNSRFVVEMVVAHEFGHALQARTGILISFNGLEANASTKAAANEWSRRGEQQADCLAGEFIRSVSRSAALTQSDLDNVVATARAIGDDTLSGKANVDGNHGLADSRQYWTQLGLASTSVAACNTFVAPADSVR
ncbi:MAG: neutral zinc metallopeptidase [Propionibacteriaceae bacterium]